MAVEKGEVDFSINPITVTDKRLERVDFSQPYFISHTAVAKRKESQAWQMIKNFLSWEFISAILVLLGVIFVFGFLVWIFERKHNSEEFGGKGLQGIKNGFWWSAVTMTTVGYGDKSPRTTGGRIIGLIWMFAAIIIISSLTAGIASALTVQNINNEINSVTDLERFKVSTVKASSSEELLNLYRISYDTINNAARGVQDVAEGKTMVFIYDQPILDYQIKEQELAGSVQVLEKTLKKDYFSYSFPKNSALIKKINPALLSTMKTMEWSRLMQDYK